MLRFFRVPGRLALAAGLVALSACSSDLQVTDPVNLTPDDLGASAPIGITINGARGAFQRAYDRHVLYTDLLSDAMVAAGTFPYQAEVDDRVIRANNEGLLGDMYVPLSVARFMADTASAILEQAKGGAGVDESARLEAVALARYFGGYTRALLAEGYCASAIAGGAALSSDDRMKDALAVFQDAETKASAAGKADLVAAARLGQARAQLWLANYPAAATAAALVPATGLAINAVYSNASVAQKNFIARETYGIDEAIRWSVGDGTVTFLGKEKFAYFDDFIAIGLIKRRPDLSAFNSVVPVVGQTKMLTGDAPIPMATSAEAQLIRAEAALRASDRSGAEGFVNPLRAKWSLAGISFTGPLAADLRVLAEERARELYLTGERLTTLRRYLKDGVDLFPTGKSGTATCFPVPQQELDTNPNAH
jgi:hypothetical protein